MIKKILLAIAALAAAASLTACYPNTAANQTIQVQGRSVLVHYDTGPTPRPLVLVLHGLNSSGAGFANSTDPKLFQFATDNDFDVALPDAGLTGSGDRAWNAGICCSGATGDDISYLHQVVTSIRKLANIDPARIYIWGHSNGGMMALRAVCQAGDMFAAAGSVAGPYLFSTCARPVFKHMHAKNDPIVPYLGGQPSNAWCGCSFPAASTEQARIGGFSSVQTSTVGSHGWPALNGAWKTDGNQVLWDSVRGFSIPGAS